MDPVALLSVLQLVGYVALVGLVVVVLFVALTLRAPDGRL